VRVTTDRAELEVAPGATASLVATVRNTDRVIDGVSARVIGLPDESVTYEPALLPLFPDAEGKVTITVTAPRHFPAGRHPIVVEIVSHGAHAPPEYVEVQLVVEAQPELQLTSRPKLAKGRRSGRFVLDVANPGNVKLQVDLQPNDANRSMTYRLSPPRLVVSPGQTTPAVLHVRAPRHISGSTLDHNINVEATAERLDLPADWVAPDAEPVRGTVDVQLRQRPMISRGLMTACILASIVALWAGAFLFGLAKVFASQPPTKQAPASFFLLKDVTRVGAVNAAFDLNAANTAGILPKSGQLPPGEASQITGQVLGWVDNQPVGRILVQAYRLKGSTPVAVSSAGTQADGTFALGGLFPTTYYLKFSATGYRTVWYSAQDAHGTSSMHASSPITTEPQGSVTTKSVIIHGLPASIRGGVDPGSTLTPVDTTVTAQLMIGNTPQGKQYVVHTDAATNRYALPDLPAPASYSLTFTAEGYQSSSIVETVGGGDVRYEPPVALTAGQGEISGVVRDAAGQPIGGAQVSTVVNGAPVSVTTPTVGLVGVFRLQNLLAPGTYVVTVNKPGFGTVTKIVGLGVGRKAVRSNLKLTLVAGTGSVHGKVVGDDGVGLGNVTVTVGGTSEATTSALPSTTTLTDGDKGSFAINGIAAPGSYTLTAQLDGYQPTTVAFDLNGTTRPQSITIQLSQNAGTVVGAVRAPGKCPETACVNAKVTATDGHQLWAVGVSSGGGTLKRGGYLLSGLPPGIYTVTVTDDGMKQQTAIVTVVNGQRTTQNFVLTRAG
jgi:hypothetical protein